MRIHYMSLEDKIDILNNQVRQILQTIDSYTKVKKLSNSEPNDSEPNNSESLDNEVEVDAAPSLSNVDIMGCPFDESMMMTNKQKYPKGHRMAGCWKKKRDKNYTDEQYMRDRRKLMADNTIEEDEPQPGASTSLFANNDDAPPQVVKSSAPPPPPVSINVELPQIDPATINQTDFVNYCDLYIKKNGEQGAFTVAQKVRQCGIGSGNHKEISNSDQAVRSWISRELKLI